MRCLSDVVRVHASERPDAPALECGDRTLTFGQLHERASRVATSLQSEGVKERSRVAFLERNGLAAFEVTFGAALLNAVAVQVNWRLAAPEVAQIVDDAEAEVLIVGPDFAPVVERIEAGLSRVRRIVSIGAHDRWTPYEEWLAAHPPEDPGSPAGWEDIAFQLYTSGTTGLPKGVMLTNRNLFALVDQVNQYWEFVPEESVNLAMMPMFHIAGLGWSVAGLAYGCRTVVLAEADPARILASISEGGVTHAFMVPALIQFLLLTPQVGETDFSSLRKLVYGASPISSTVLVQAMEVMGCEFVQVYGLTETTGAITQLLAEEHDPVNRPELLRSCGRPFPWVEIRIVDAATGQDAVEGEVGELWTRSPQVMAGYWHNDQATRAALTDDGWFKTGDAGYRDDEGFLYLHDRIKDMIVSGGENVYPAEVENALMQHPAVADVAVIGVPDERWGETVKAVVVAVDDAARPPPAELMGFCRERLAGFKCPKSVDFATDLPRNPSGKLLKRELRAPYWEGRARFVG